MQKMEELLLSRVGKFNDNYTAIIAMVVADDEELSALDLEEVEAQNVNENIDQTAIIEEYGNTLVMDTGDLNDIANQIKEEDGE